MFICDLQGMKKEEVKVEVDEGRVQLSENAKVDQVRASMENGVLLVTIPKRELKKPQTKVIQIEGN